MKSHPGSFVALRFDRSLFIPKQVALSSRLRQGHVRARDCATNYGEAGSLVGVMGSSCAVGAGGARSLVGDAMGSSCAVGAGGATGSAGDCTGSSPSLWLKASDDAEGEGTERSLSQLRLNCARRLLSATASFKAVARCIRLRSFSSSGFLRMNVVRCSTLSQPEHCHV